MARRFFLGVNVMAPTRSCLQEMKRMSVNEEKRRVWKFSLRFFLVELGENSLHQLPQHKAPASLSLEDWLFLGKFQFKTFRAPEEIQNHQRQRLCCSEENNYFWSFKMVHGQNMGRVTWRWNTHIKIFSPKNQKKENFLFRKNPLSSKTLWNILFLFFFQKLPGFAVSQVPSFRLRPDPELASGVPSDPSSASHAWPRRTSFDLHLSGEKGW